MILLALFIPLVCVYWGSTIFKCHFPFSHRPAKELLGNKQAFFRLALCVLFVFETSYIQTDHAWSMLSVALTLRSSFMKTMPSSRKNNALLAHFFYGPAKKTTMWDQCITVFSWQQRLTDDAAILCSTRFNKRCIQKLNIDTWRQDSTVLSTCEIYCEMWICYSFANHLLQVILWCISLLSFLVFDTDVVSIIVCLYTII